ncbi:hypothetical protein BC937DRAFT_93339 [Endogone sp. FLAS-F59071]|nr:hypothetical protein BC937DRAFT_93339 [Endogone sp. FLAS-F59071]|eukprot:RUS21210.1 hypothetical protein BC937DRAFT_93339 [Endogone sp. FLAS-F59071]
MKSTIIALFIAAAFVGQSQAGGAAKAGSFNAKCVHFYTVGGTDTCSSVAAAYGITTTQLFSWNPKLHTTCDNLDDGSLVCVSLTGPAVTDPAGSHSGATAASSAAAATSAKSSKAASASASAASFASAPAASSTVLASSVDTVSAAGGSSAGSPTAAVASANGTSSTAPTVSVAKSAGTRERISVVLLLGAVAAAGVLAL